jgi:hypothetical protein
MASDKPTEVSFYSIVHAIFNNQENELTIKLTTMRKTITTAIFAALLLNVMAQAPQGISHQAVIRNAANELVINSPIGIKVSILQGSASGTVAYSETHTPMSNTNGLISFVIGQGAVLSGVFANIDWASGPYFIKTQADPEGGSNYTISGTTQILSVPYALHASQAVSLVGGVIESDPVFLSSPSAGITSSHILNWNVAYGWGNHAVAGYLTGNQNITLTGNVTGSGATSIATTIANNTISTAKIVNLAVNEAKLANNAVTTSKINNNAVTIEKLPAGATNTSYLRGDGTWQTILSLPSGSAGQTLRYTGSNWAANSVLFNNGTNIGIGTTSPVEKLDVNGAIKLGNSSSPCDATHRGTLRFLQGGPGISDKLYVCLKSKSDFYYWKDLTFESQNCDDFNRVNSTVVAGWTEVVGDWEIFSNQLRSQASSTWQWITFNGSTQANGTINCRATYGSGLSVRAAGITARFESASSYVLAKIQDNSMSGSWDSWFIYCNGATITYGSGVNYGTDANIQLEYDGANVVFKIDTNRDGIWDHTHTATVTKVSAGLCGAQAYQQVFIDDYCYE